jgi:5-methylcytosine-specific restriction endonuclease McrA
MKISLDALYERDGGICQLCFRPCDRNSASRDHIRPRSRGGSDNPNNIQLAHRLCNWRRGSSHLQQTPSVDEHGAYLRFKMY